MKAWKVNDCLFIFGLIFRHQRLYLLPWIINQIEIGLEVRARISYCIHIKLHIYALTSKIVKINADESRADYMPQKTMVSIIYTCLTYLYINLANRW